MATKKEEIIEIKAINKKIVKIKIVGDTPLIVHAWDEKAKKMLEAPTPGVKRGAKHDRYAEFINGMYWITEKPSELTEKAFNAAVKKGAKWGFPANAIKMAGNAAAYRMGWVKNQMQLRGSYFMLSEYDELVEIKGSVPQMRDDMVRIGQGTADIRFRPVWEDWYMEMNIEYNADGALTLEEIINVINAGGYSVGIGEWRPERDGNFGRYHVEA